MGERGGDFREADQKYGEAVRRRDAGEIGREEFEAERKRLMILDEEGRWWAKSAKTGEWKFHDGNDWKPGVPPGYDPSGESMSEEGSEIEESPGESETISGASRPVGPAREVADGEGRRSGASLRRPLVLAAFLLAVLLVGGGYALTRGVTLTSGGGGMGGSGGSVEVPDLIGSSSIEEAREAVGEDFEVVEAERVESEEPIGAVVSQNPDPGERVDENSTVFVETSRGVAVPDVEGDERGEAVRTLEEVGFEVEEEAEESSGGDEGRILAQKPRAGENAEAGSVVEITVSETDDSGSGDAGPQTGAPADFRVRVPDVIGERVEDAEETLEDAGFSTDIEAVESGEPKGTVVWADPEADVLFDPSSGEVVIGASSGPPETPPESPPESPPDEQYTPPEEGS